MLPIRLQRHYVSAMALLPIDLEIKENELSSCTHDDHSMENVR